MSAAAILITDDIWQNAESIAFRLKCGPSGVKSKCNPCSRCSFPSDHCREIKGKIMKVFLPSAAATLGVSASLLVLTTTASTAQTPATNTPDPALGPSDTYFVSQTSLGAPFQVDSGRLAESKGTTQAIRSYAKLMVSSHITVNNALLGILKSKSPAPPPTLLKAAYHDGFEPAE
jgi:hypothetical protein